MNSEKLNESLLDFLNHIESINETLPMSVLLLSPFQKKAKKNLTKFINENSENLEPEEEAISIKLELVRVYDKLIKNVETSTIALKIIPESLFVSLISQFDAFMNRLLRALFEIRPEFINSSERNLSFSQLIQFSSIDDAKHFIVEKEVESVLRKSHSDHFKYLENKLSIPLTKNLSIWKDFIEVTERRNLFVHCDGVISSQYINTCKSVNYDVSKIKVNDKLKIDGEYFRSAFITLYEIAVKLTHTIWRKLLIDDLQKADDELNDICYKMMDNGEFYLADILLEFAANQKKHHNQSTKNYQIVNLSLSQYLQGHKEKAKKIINK